MKLNGWQRMGVVLSLLWVSAISAIGFCTVGNSGVDREAWYALPDSAFGMSVEGYYNGFRPELCAPLHEERPDIVPNVANCVRFAEDNAYGEPSFGLKGMLLFGLLPVLFAWAMAYLSLFAYRWIAAGFKDNGGTNGQG